MEALIPKFFILSVEASIVLFLILIVIIVFNSRARRKDIKAADKMVKKYISHKDERLSALKNQLQNIGFIDNQDTQAEQLYEQEKSLIKEFVGLYLKHDSDRLLDYADNITAMDNLFLKTTGTASAAVPQEPEVESSEQNANAAILAREQEESHEEHLKELSELRLKNTELNEHLFEALETITALITEHGKKTGQEVDCNAQKVLQAIIYLRDQRLEKDGDAFGLTPDADEQDRIEDLISADLAENDATLDDSTVIDLGLSDNLSLGDEFDIDLDSNTINTDEGSEEDDPWADALAEQAMAEESTAEEEEDPWAEALAEQKKSENK